MKHRVREAIFNLVGTDAAGKHAIDVFAGTGALGLEAISRGAESATLIERHVPTATVVKQNLAAVGRRRAACELLVTSAFVWGKRDLEGDCAWPPAGPQSQRPWLAFVSPPYAFFVERQEEMLTLIRVAPRRTPRPGSVLVVEADERFDFEQSCPMACLKQERSGPGWDVRVLSARRGRGLAISGRTVFADLKLARMNTRLLPWRFSCRCLPSRLSASMGQSQDDYRQRLWDGVALGRRDRADEPVTEQRGNARAEQPLDARRKPRPGPHDLHSRPTHRARRASSSQAAATRGLAIDKEGHFPAAWLAERGVLGVVVSLPVRWRGKPLSDSAAWMASAPCASCEPTQSASALNPGSDRRDGLLGGRASWLRVVATLAGGATGRPRRRSAGRRFLPGPTSRYSSTRSSRCVPEVTHGGSCRQLLGEKPSNPELASPPCPPMSTSRTADAADVADPLGRRRRSLPLANPMRYFDACQQHGVDAELHVYPTGGHGYGMWAEQRIGERLARLLLKNWLQSRGYATP